jgi:arylsulfatase A-like enzyme
MGQKGMPYPGRNHFRVYLAAGIVGGCIAGFMTAYLETMFLLATVGPFWVDFPFLLKALLLYGPAGATGGGLGSLFLYLIYFRQRPLRDTRPWIFFFALFSAGGLILELLLFQMDIFTFRNLDGEWTTPAYFVLGGGIMVSCLLGWMLRKVCQHQFQGGIRKCLLRGGIALFLCASLFLLVRGFMVFQERPSYESHPGSAVKVPANIIILLVDSLRPDHLSAYGYPLPTSPTIDRLAGEGVLFLNCLAASTWTVPTHTSLFTGLYPSSHGNYSMYSSLDSSIPTMSRLLADKGYRTASLFDNKLLGSRHGLAQGFQTALGVDNVNKLSLSILRLWQRLRGNRSMGKTILHVADKWIEYKSPRGQPFFLFVNFMDTHVPYRPKKPYIDDFLRSLRGERVNSKLASKFTTDEITTREAAAELARRLTAADWRWLERFYDSNIRALDDQIAWFLASLKAKGFLQNTLVIVTSDHGEYFGERGIGGHLNSSMHNAGLRIPLLLWFPGRLAPGKVELPVSQVDIFSTVLRLAGFAAEIPGQVQGRDLFSIPENRELLVEFWDDVRKRFSRAFVSGDFKLLITASGKQELYDLKNDVAEITDLAQLHPDLVAQLVLRLQGLLRSMPQRKSREEAGKKKEMEKLLKSIGYL